VVQADAGIHGEVGVVTRPAENQQTVEAARILDRALTSEGAMARYYRGLTDWGQFHEAIEKERAALRDLVAQADQAQDIARRIDALWDAGGDDWWAALEELRALARLDGALQTKEQA